MKTEEIIPDTERSVKKLHLKIIVNGTLTEVTENVHHKLGHAAAKALEQTGNTARPLDDWQIMYLGQVLDMKEEIAHFNFPQGAELFLSLKAGHGGE